MEYLLTHDYSIPSVMKAFDAFLEDYRKNLGPETDEKFAPKTPENAIITLNAYAKKWREDLETWKPLYTEIAGVVNLSDEHTIHFRMDSILEHRKKGTIISLEHKTASSTWNWELQWPLSNQNGIYTHVMNCLYNTEIVRGVTFRATVFKKVKKAWEQLHSGTTLTVQPPYDFLEFPAAKSSDQMQLWLWNTIFWLDQIKWQFNLLADTSESDQVMFAFPQNPTNCTKYFGCEYSDFCQAWPNPLIRCQVPLGFQEEHWDPSAVEAKHTFEIGEK
jgi:hypothetical protein